MKRVSSLGFRVSGWAVGPSTRNSKLGTRDRRAAPAAGYTLVAVVIGMAVLVILTAAVAPAVSVIMQRDREDELIFRGRQYARGIVIFQRRFGRLPTSLKEMYENQPRSIRKLFKDPMCNCDNWFLIIQGSAESGIGGAIPTQQTGLQPTPVPKQSASPFQPQTTGPIVGVRSQVKKEGLKEWQGQKSYDQWRFIMGQVDRGILPPGPGNRAPGPAPPVPQQQPPRS
jgi:type II secretory pathway pseudopilin PulG